MNEQTALMVAIIEAARKLVREHVESEIVSGVDASGIDTKWLRLLIRPPEGQSFGCYLSEGDESDNLFTALADLLGAVDAYDEAMAETEGYENE